MKNDFLFQIGRDPNKVLAKPPPVSAYPSEPLHAWNQTVIGGCPERRYVDLWAHVAGDTRKLQTAPKSNSMQNVIQLYAQYGEVGDIAIPSEQEDRDHRFLLSLFLRVIDCMCARIVSEAYRPGGVVRARADRPGPKCVHETN